MSRIAFLILLLPLAGFVQAQEGLIYVEEAIEADTVQLTGDTLSVRACKDCQVEHFELGPNFQVQQGGVELPRASLMTPAPGTVVYDIKTRKARLVVR